MWGERETYFVDTPRIKNILTPPRAKFWIRHCWNDVQKMTPM